jgi:hypothetical protein
VDASGADRPSLTAAGLAPAAAAGQSEEALAWPAGSLGLWLVVAGGVVVAALVLAIRGRSAGH